MSIIGSEESKQDHTGLKQEIIDPLSLPFIENKDVPQVNSHKNLEK